MTEIRIEDGSSCSYILPLDSLDLAYLMKFIEKPREQKKPIWSKTRLDGNSEYYEVTIEAEDINESDCYFEPSDTYLCQICNLNVPKIYFKEHNAGSQHQTFKKICENVLDRVSKQIGVGFVDTNSETKEDVYYCTPCSQVVKLKNKYKHESSDYHKKSEENLTIIKDFYKLCTDNKCEELNVSNESKDSKTSHGSEKNEIVDSEKTFCTICNIYIDKHMLADHVNTGTHKRTVGNCLKCNTYINSQANEDSFFGYLSSDDEFVSTTSDQMASHTKYQTISNLESLESQNEDSSFGIYISEMIAKYNLNVNAPLTEGDYIYIVTPNGSQRKVTRDQFHGYKRSVTSVHCQVCRMIISSFTEAHDVAEWHVRNIFKPVDDHFIRTLSNDWSHCLVCNKAVFFAINHDKDSYHKRKMSESNLSENSEKTVLVKRKKSKKSKHRTKKNKRDNVVWTTLQPTVAQSALSEYCDICKVDVPKGGMAIHNDGRFHKRKLNATLNMNVSEEDGDTREVQNIAEANSMENINAQVNDTAVINAGASTSGIGKDLPEINIFNWFPAVTDIEIPYFSLLRYADDKNNKVKCRICDVNFPIDRQIITDHMKGSNHAEAKDNLYVFHRIDKYSCFCECCEESVWDFFGHINSNAHILKFQKKIVVDAHLVRHYVYEDKICNASAIKYRELYHNLITSNDIHILSDSEFYCEVCLVLLARITEINHILSLEHIVAIAYRD